MNSRIRFLILVGAVLFAACNRSTPTSPTPPVVPSSPFIGVWVGPIVDTTGGSGTLQLTVTDHVAISLIGSWTSTYTDQALNDNGPLSASVQGSTVNLILRGQFCNAPFGSSARVMTGEMTVEGTRMAGSYISTGCGPPRDGRIELTKQ